MGSRVAICTCLLAFYPEEKKGTSLKKSEKEKERQADRQTDRQTETERVCERQRVDAECFAERRQM